MECSRRVYLDNAATSFPKPAAVYDAVDRFNRSVGVPFGRGAYAQAMEVQSVVERCRQRAAELLGAERPDRIVFTFNGTDSLNFALSGLLEPGDHVVTSVVEHNSVLRPLRELQERRGVDVSYVEADAAGRVDPADVRRALRPGTRLVALIHASNVTGAIQPIADVGEMARQSGALVLVDAAQTAGHVPIDLGRLPVDLLACPGHKGLLGPLGTGLLYVRPGVEAHLASHRQGGTGTKSEEDRQPAELPDKYEAGNHNVPGLFGLEAALDWIQDQTIERVAAHERDMTARLIDALRGVPDLELYDDAGVDGPDPSRVGVVSLNLPGVDPHVLASILDERFHVQVRSGLHCAPGIHRRMGTFEAGGTVRLSVGPFTTGEHIDTTIAALREIAASF